MKRRWAGIRAGLAEALAEPGPGPGLPVQAASGSIRSMATPAAMRRSARVRGRTGLRMAGARGTAGHCTSGHSGITSGDWLDRRLRNRPILVEPARASL